MKKLLTSLTLGLATAGSLSAATIIGDGAARPFSAAGADGWSGVTVIDTANIDATTEAGPQTQFQLTEVSFYVDDARAAGVTAGSHHLVPLLVNSANDIAWVGATLTPSTTGHNVFPVSSATLDINTDTYRFGFWQWNDGVDDTSGGIVSFAAAGGGGMFQTNLDGTQGASAVSVGQNLPGGHASPAGGRDYHIDAEVTFIPEPSAFGLVGIAGLGFLLRRRRR